MIKRGVLVQPIFRTIRDNYRRECSLKQTLLTESVSSDTEDFLLISLCIFLNILCNQAVLSASQGDTVVTVGHMEIRPYPDREGDTKYWAVMSLNIDSGNFCWSEISQI